MLSYSDPPPFFCPSGWVKFNALCWPSLGKNTVVYIKLRGQGKTSFKLGQSLLRRHFTKMRIFVPNLTRMLTMSN